MDFVCVLNILYLKLGYGLKLLKYVSLPHFCISAHDTYSLYIGHVVLNTLPPIHML